MKIGEMPQTSNIHKTGMLIYSEDGVQSEVVTVDDFEDKFKDIYKGDGVEDYEEEQESYSATNLDNWDSEQALLRTDAEECVGVNSTGTPVSTKNDFVKVYQYNADPRDDLLFENYQSSSAIFHNDLNHTWNDPAVSFWKTYRPTPYHQDEYYIDLTDGYKSFVSFFHTAQAIGSIMASKYHWKPFPFAVIFNDWFNDPDNQALINSSWKIKMIGLLPVFVAAYQSADTERENWTEDVYDPTTGQKTGENHFHRFIRYPIYRAYIPEFYVIDYTIKELISDFYKIESDFGGRGFWCYIPRRKMGEKSYVYYSVNASPTPYPPSLIDPDNWENCSGDGDVIGKVAEACGNDRTDKLRAYLDVFMEGSIYGGKVVTDYTDDVKCLYYSSYAPYDIGGNANAIASITHDVMDIFDALVGATNRWGFLFQNGELSINEIDKVGTEYWSSRMEKTPLYDGYLNGFAEIVDPELTQLMLDDFKVINPNLASCYFNSHYFKATLPYPITEISSLHPFIELNGEDYLAYLFNKYFAGELDDFEIDGSSIVERDALDRKLAIFQQYLNSDNPSIKHGSVPGGYGIYVSESIAAEFAKYTYVNGYEEDLIINLTPIFRVNGESAVTDIRVDDVSVVDANGVANIDFSNLEKIDECQLQSSYDGHTNVNSSMEIDGNKKRYVYSVDVTSSLKHQDNTGYSASGTLGPSEYGPTNIDSQTIYSYESVILIFTVTVVSPVDAVFTMYIKDQNMPYGSIPFDPNDQYYDPTYTDYMTKEVKADIPTKFQIIKVIPGTTTGSSSYTYTNYSLYALHNIDQTTYESRTHDIQAYKTHQVKELIHS